MVMVRVSFTVIRVRVRVPYPMIRAYFRSRVRASPKYVGGNRVGKTRNQGAPFQLYSLHTQFLSSEPRLALSN